MHIEKKKRMIKIENNKIILGSYDIDHIFSGIKEKENSEIIKQAVISNFEFEMNLSNFQKVENIYEIGINIPKNKIIQKSRSSFIDFEDLFNYIYSFKFEENIVPYNGTDLE